MSTRTLLQRSLWDAILSFTPTISYVMQHKRTSVPQQKIEYEERIDHISLIIRDGSRIHHEEELPLYRQEGGLSTEEISVCMERPSQDYYIGLSAH